MTEQPTIPADEARPPLFVGIDIGGTSIKLGVVDDQGATLGFARVPTQPRQPPQRAVERIAAAYRDLLGQRQIPANLVVAAGLGSPGTMDIPTGMLLEPPNLYAWHNFPIRDAIGEALGLPVAFANDGAAAAYGEFWLGRGRHDSSLVMLTLGTGVGGGIIHHNLSIDGQHSHGSECGHVIIDSGANARVCSCGQAGHLEAYASATAVALRTGEALASGRESSLQRRIDAGEKLTSLMVSEEAAVGDDLSVELVLETAGFLAIGITSLVHTIDPAVVVLGGAMDFGGAGTPLGARFLERIVEQFGRRTFPTLARETRIEFAELGGDAGYLGAAGLGRKLAAEQS